MAGDARAKELLDLGDRLFSKRERLVSLWQELAENFYPERADFYGQDMLGEDFAIDLSDSFPVMLRRELANSMSAMLRPKDKPWFRVSTLDDEIDNNPINARSLEYVTKVVRRNCYNPISQFVRSTKEGDEDWTTFGQCVISVEENREDDTLFFGSHHLRDCAWLTNARKVIDHLHRKDAMTARAMKQKFKKEKLHRSILQACEKEPWKEFPLRCIVLPANEYDYMSKDNGGKKPRKLPFVIVYIDVENCVILEEAGLPDFIYVVPRWKTISGSQYAFSPATMTALPDARMSQMLANILLESGEKAVDPPALANAETVRDANIQSGALTWVDYVGDGRLQDQFQLLEFKGDMRTGFAMRQDLRELLSKAFFIDRLRLPEGGQAETATEIRALLEEHVRNLLPLFEPMEIEYNVKLLDKALSTLMNMNKIDPEMISDDLSAADVSFKFESPIQEASDLILVEKFQKALEIEMAAGQAGVGAPRVNIGLARDDAIRGISAPARWRRTDEEMQKQVEQAQEEAAMVQAAQEVSLGAETATQVAGASQAVGEAMQPLPPPQPQRALPPPRRAA